uniref:Flotillin n=1 Tax=Saimiri boliviensis boliviensis TaxID=39432 RepID=A0A2K6SZX7_SAIBB
MFFTCGLNEAMVVSGFCRSPPVMVPGGRVFVFPCIQQIRRIFLNTLTLNVKSEKIYTRHGVPISVTGIAQVKIQGQNKEMLAATCQMFLGKTEAEIAHITLGTLEGQQRAIMAHMTVKEDRQKFSEQVFKVASSGLVNMGISVAQTAQVQKDARIGEAEAKRDAGIREAKAKQEKVSAQSLSEIEMAKTQRDYELTKATHDIEVSTYQAQADLACQLQMVAEEICGPLISANKITLVSIGSGTMGAATVTGEVLDILSNLPESVERLTGVSISPVNHKPLQTA